MQNRISLFFSVILLTFLTSCKSDVKQENVIQQTKKSIESTKYVLTPFSESPSFDDARINGMSYENGAFDFDVSGDVYKLGEQTSDAPQKMCANSAKGQHIHLIIDNAPYAAKYTPQFDYEVADGEHYLLAFLSRSYHESIKTDQANIFKKVKVENGNISSSADITEPMVLYSRPKGSYVGNDTKKVMLDFYLQNTSISEDGNYVEADINGEVHKIHTWQPYYIENLPNGDNTIKLTLKDAEGNRIETPLNPVTRTFKLQADPEPKH